MGERAYRRVVGGRLWVRARRVRRWVVSGRVAIDDGWGGDGRGGYGIAGRGTLGVAGGSIGGGKGSLGVSVGEGILAGMTRSYDAVVLAGGAGRRLGGVDKPALSVGGRMLLDRVLAACAGAGSTVVVGPRRPTARPVGWAREEPAGGGPLPALAAGLAGLGAGRSGVVLVLAADLPFLAADTVHALVDTLTGEPDDREGAAAGGDGVLLVDGDGRDQPLAAAYRIEPLRRELALLRAEHGGLAGLPLRLLTGELELRRIADPTGEATFDCDTWADVAAARARLDTASEG